MISQDGKILLGMKKRGFGVGRWNGFGGKVEKGEFIEDAAKREVFEEIGVQVVDFEKVGILEFEFQKNPEILETHIFRVNQFNGTPTESEEMKPQWFDVKNIPFNGMWSDDKYWVPLFLEGKKFKGHILFGEKDVTSEVDIQETDTV